MSCSFLINKLHAHPVGAPAANLSCVNLFFFKKKLRRGRERASGTCFVHHMLYNAATTHVKAINVSDITCAWQCAGTRPYGPIRAHWPPFAGALARLQIVQFNVSVLEMDCKGVWMVYKATNIACASVHAPLGRRPP